MSVCEAAVYGNRRGFVYLRYVALVFFFLSQIATYFVILQVLQQTTNALNALEKLDIAGVITAVTSFKIAGPFGTFIGVLRSLGALVIPLYFIATVSFVLNLNRREMGKVLRRTALMAVVLSVAEFLVFAVLIGIVAVFVATLFQTVAAEYADIMDAVDVIVGALNTEFTLPVQNAEDLLAVAQSFATTQICLILLRNLPSFNIFLDELLCLLMCYFFCLRPKRAESGPKLALYRAFGVLPILFILMTFVLNGLTQTGAIEPNLTLLSIFPAKKLPQFLFVGCILFHNRMRPVKELRPWEGLSPVGRPKKEFRAVPLSCESKEEERRRAFSSAVFLGVCLALLCAADLCSSFLPFAAKWGMGKSYYAVFCVPFLFFFDDRKPVSKKAYSVFLAIYMAVIAVIVLIYLFF